MKQLFFVLLATELIACGDTDKTATAGTTTQPVTEIRDSVPRTSIQWLDSIHTDLGNVKEGREVEVSYRFRNSGTSNLIFTSVTASCGCTVPEKPERPYAPGEEGVIKAKFDSKGRPHGEAQKNVYVEANTEPSRQSLTFKVNITD